MTISGESFSEKLRAWILSRTNGGAPIYDIYDGPQQFEIVETENDGRAEIRCALPAEYTCAVFQLHGNDGLFGFLCKSNNADGAVLFVRPNGRIAAWVVECKRTLKQGSWEKALVQFKWTLARLLAVAGVIGVEIEEVLLATAFREDRLSEEESPNPTLGKAPIGPSADTEINGARRNQLAWMNDEVEIRGIPGRFRHRKLRLDANGDGSCRVDE